MRKTKIICTIGPVSEPMEMMEKLVKAGMNVIRLNFSHGDHEEHGARIKTLRAINEKLGTNVAILVDTKGPEIRIGIMENDGVEFKTGDIVTVTVDKVLGTKDKFQIVCPELFADANVDTKLLVDDGKITMTVIKKDGNDLVCRIENSGIIKTKKGINVPNVALSMPFISEKDDADIRFAARNDCDFLAASFVRRASDIHEIRKILAEEGNDNIEIIAKIENQEGFDNLEEIIEASDGVMVARGDLGVEVSLQLVPMYQKEMIRMANKMGKPVVTATHMLESMTGNPRPTRAEASDVANAVMDGSDAIMLSGESAAGLYPVESVTTMATIAEVTESILDYQMYTRRNSEFTSRTINEAIGIAVSESCLTLDNVSCIMAFTETGGTPKRLCRFRPLAPIIAATNSVQTARKMSIYWGVYPVLDDDIIDADLYDKTAGRIANKLDLPKGSKMIITAGWRAGHGNTNTMFITEVE